MSSKEQIMQAAYGPTGYVEPKEKQTASHTPGPWVLKPDAVLMYRTLITPENSHAPIGSVYGNINDIENGANARLIAAAPDLLGALERLIAWVDAQDLEYESAMVRQAKAAIAKAKGEV